jgi:hypothetical protein
MVSVNRNGGKTHTLQGEQVCSLMSAFVQPVPVCSANLGGSTWKESYLEAAQVGASLSGSGQTGSV